MNSCFDCQMNRKMNFEYFIFGIAFLIFISGCSGCFTGNQEYSQKLKTGSTFYMECRCDDPPVSRITLKWFDTHDNEILPSGPGTKSNVYTEWWDELTYSLYITNISKSVSGTYKCVTDYNGRQYSHTYDVEAYDPPYFINTKETQYVVSGSDALISCEAKGDVTPLITWHKDSFEPIQVNDNDKFEVTQTGLLIRNISKEDNGVYKCAASDLETGEEVAIDIKVEVISMPEIIELVAIPDNVAYEGASISMECIASGTPPPEYSWRKISNSNENSTNYKQIMNKIEFENIDASDRGVYECIATNIAGNHTKKLELKVLVPPKITQFNNVTAVEDGTIQVVCKAQGIPLPKINIQYLGESDDLSIVWESKQTSENETELYLTFLRVKQSHEGSYICNATNDVDSDTEEMFLTVLYKPYFKKPIENVWGWKGNSVVLNCDAESNPPAQITWRYQGSDISTEKQLEIDRIIIDNGNNAPAVLNNETMYGVYECIAKNKYGEAKKIIVFLEGFAPPPIRNVTLLNITSTSAVFAIEGPDEINGPPVIGFTSEYDEAKNYNITDIHINRTWSIDRPYKINKLRPNTVYFIRFAALNDVGTGVWSDYVDFSTLEKSSPEEPIWDSDLESVNNGVLKWKTVEDNGEQIDYYVVKYCQVLDLAIQTEKCYEETIDPTNEFYLNNLEANSTYYFELVAHNSLGNSTVASTYITLPEKESRALSMGPVLGIAVVVVFLSLVLLDFLLLLLKRKGIIANCVYKKKDTKIARINARDRKGLLKNNSKGEERTTNGHKEYEYNKKTGVITGKHSAV